jgi:hypothetical protein
MTDTITIRSHSSSNSPVVRKNNRQGNSSRKTIKPYKRSSTRPGLAAGQARTPATKDTSSSQATLRGVNPKLTEPPIARRHKVLSFVSQSNRETDCKVCTCAPIFIYFVIMLSGISKYHSSRLRLYLLQDRRLPCKTKVTMFWYSFISDNTEFF